MSLAGARGRAAAALSILLALSSVSTAVSRTAYVSQEAGAREGRVGEDGMPPSESLSQALRDPTVTMIVVLGTYYNVGPEHEQLDEARQTPLAVDRNLTVTSALGRERAVLDLAFATSLLRLCSTCTLTMTNLTLANERRGIGAQYDALVGRQGARVVAQHVFKLRVACTAPEDTAAWVSHTARSAAFPGADAPQRFTFVSQEFQGVTYPQSLEVLDFSVDQPLTYQEGGPPFGGYSLWERDKVRLCKHTVPQSCTRRKGGDSCVRSLIDQEQELQAAAGGPAAPKARARPPGAAAAIAAAAAVGAAAAALLAAGVALLVILRRRRRAPAGDPKEGYCCCCCSGLGPGAPGAGWGKRGALGASVDDSALGSDSSPGFKMLTCAGAWEPLAARREGWSVTHCATAPLLGLSEGGLVELPQFGKLLGTGSFGRVFLATWRDQEVAVKVIEHAAAVSLAVDNEVELMLSFDHPNVIKALCCITLKHQPRPRQAPEGDEQGGGGSDGNGGGGGGTAEQRVVVRVARPQARQALHPRDSASSAPLGSQGPGKLPSQLSVTAGTSSGCDGGCGIHGGTSGSTSSRAGSSTQRTVHSGAPDALAPAATCVGDGLGLQSALQQHAAASSAAAAARPCAGSTPPAAGGGTPGSGLSLVERGGAPAAAAAGSCQAAGSRSLSSGSASGPGRMPDGEAERAETLIIAEFCDCGTLSSVAARCCSAAAPGDDLERVLRLATLLLDAARGLEALHDANVVHGDLNARNVLVSSSPSAPFGLVAKVADLGLSRVMKQHETHRTTNTVGTMSHMPPEMLNYGHMSAAGDIYAFGVMAWELFTGSAAFRKLHYGQFYDTVVRHDLRPVIPPAMPDDYRLLVEHCWATDPMSRPTARTLVECLEFMRVQRHAQLGLPLQEGLDLGSGGPFAAAATAGAAAAEGPAGAAGGSPSNAGSPLSTPASPGSPQPPLLCRPLPLRHQWQAQLQQGPQADTSDDGDHSSSEYLALDVRPGWPQRGARAGAEAPEQGGSNAGGGGGASGQAPASAAAPLQRAQTECRAALRQQEEACAAVDLPLSEPMPSLALGENSRGVAHGPWFV